MSPQTPVMFVREDAKKHLIINYLDYSSAHRVSRAIGRQITDKLID
jgi:hypothetical protein